jgi:hypothetical protein
MSLVGGDGRRRDLGVIEDLGLAGAEIACHEGGASGVDQPLQVLADGGPGGAAACRVIDEARERH